MTERAQKVMEAFYQPMNRSSHYYDKFSVAAAIRETINQLQQSPGVIMCADFLELCEEIEKL
jgi:cytidine deaminase